jgi:hypothetical protein
MRQAPKGEAAAIIAGRGVSPVGAATQPTRLAGICVMSVVVVVPCDHPFGWEALVNPSWPGLLRSPRAGLLVCSSASASAACT